MVVKKKVVNETFKKHSELMMKYADMVDIKEAMRSRHTGLGKVRDKVVHLKNYWNETQSYYSLGQAIIMMGALVPLALFNFNLFLNELGFGFVIPVAFTTFFIFIAVCSFFVVGYLSYCKFGLIRRNMEISSLISPAEMANIDFLQKIFDKVTVIEKRLDDLEDDCHGR